MGIGSFIFGFLFVIISVPVLAACVKGYLEVKSDSEYKHLAAKAKRRIIATIIIALIGYVSYVYLVYTDVVADFATVAPNYRNYNDGLYTLFATCGFLCYLAIFIPLAGLPNKGSIERIKETALRKIEMDEKDRQITERFEQIKAIYLEKKKSVPRNAQKIEVMQYVSGLFMRGGEYFVWKQANNICLLIDELLRSTITLAENIENYYKVKILPISKIEYYSMRGEIYRENKISGGGGGGSSIKGAVAGGIIAGNAGAVIGSRKKVDPITSELITHDTREAFINFYNDKGDRESILLAFEGYQTLLDILPEKDYNIVAAVKANNLIAQQAKLNDTQSITEQIKELAALKDSGILTEEEFAEKKKDLLDRI